MEIIIRPASCWRLIPRTKRLCPARCRPLSTYHRSIPAGQIKLPPPGLEADKSTPLRRIAQIPSPPSTAKAHPDPMSIFKSWQLSRLDPRGLRTSLLAPTNVEAARAGDVLLARFTTGEPPFAGKCLDIRRRGVDTAVLLRNELTRVAVEVWIKVYSPRVRSVEIVERATKRPRRARLTYFRKKEHDVRSVEGVVEQYERRRKARETRGGVVSLAVGAGGKKKKDAAAGAKKKKAKGKDGRK